MMKSFFLIISILLTGLGNAAADEAYDWFKKARNSKNPAYQTECYSKAIQAAANRPDGDKAILYNNRGVARGRQGDYARAIEDYGAAIKLQPKYAHPYNNRGAAYDDEKQYDKALEDYNKAIEIDPRYANAYFNRGNTYFSLRQFPRAVSDYGKAIDLKPDYARAYYHRGKTLLRLGKHPESIQDFSKAIQLVPEYLAAFFSRGKAHCLMGKNAEAISDFDEVISINPDHAEAYYRRGKAYRDLNQYARAIDDFQKAISLRPEYAEACNSLAWLYATAKNKKDRNGPKAVELALKSVSLKETASALDTLGAAYVENRQYKKALEAYKKAMARDESRAKAYRQALKKRGYLPKPAGGQSEGALEKALLAYLESGAHF